MKDNENLQKYIKEIPSLLAIPLNDYIMEENPVLRLWAICDFTELISRLTVICGFADLRKKGLITDKIIEDIKKNISRPTFGQWKNMCLIIAKAYVEKNKDFLLYELKPFIIDTLIPFIEGNKDSSLIGLRNQLAHGGGISKSAAARLLTKWDSRFNNFIEKIDFLKDLKLIFVDHESNFRVLSGADKIYPVYNISQKLKNELQSNLKNNVIFLVKGVRSLSLWPLTVYGELHEEQYKYNERTQHIFTRQEDEVLDYTPVNSDLVCVTKSQKEEFEEFLNIFKIDKLTKQEVAKPYKIRVFEKELEKDAIKFIGREEETNTITEKIKNGQDNILCCLGKPGVGKSFLMSKIYTNLKKHTSSDFELIVYRFKDGDDRCNCKDFLIYCGERLNNFQCVKHKIKNIENISIDELIKQLRSIVDKTLIFIIDGLDELNKGESERLKKLFVNIPLPNTKWVFFFRKEISLEFMSSKYNSISIGAMAEKDIREIIIERLGSYRKKIIINDVENGDKITNPFIDKIAEYSEGMPIYVYHVINDIISNNIKSLDTDLILPPSLNKYYEKIIAKSNMGIIQEIKSPILSFICIAKEPLNAELIKSMLIESGIIFNYDEIDEDIEKSIFSISIFTKKIERQDGTQGYIIYHKTFKNFMEENKFLKISMYFANMRIINLMKASVESTALKKYLLNFGVQHLIEIFPENEKFISDIIINKLSDLSYIGEKYDTQRFDKFIEDIYNSYNIILKNNSSGAEKICDCFSKFILKKVVCKDSKVLDIEHIHALLVHRKDSTFYKNFLRCILSEQNYIKDVDLQCVDESYFSFKARLANFERREGNYENALKLLKNCEEFFLKVNNYKEAAKVQYDIGYIYFLKGEKDTFIKAFDNSLNSSKLSSDDIGYAITNCVKNTYGFYVNLVQYDDCVTTLEQSLQVFLKNSINENARRWIMNVYAHKFEVSYIKGNQETALDCYNELEKNQWIKDYSREDMLNKYKARVYALKNEYEKAAEVCRGYLECNEKFQVNYKTEMLAKEYVFYLEILKKLGKYDKIRYIEEIIRNLPDDCGNLYFK